MNDIEKAIEEYRERECPSITDKGLLFSHFGVEMALYDEKIFEKKQNVRVSQIWTDASGDLQIDGLCILIDSQVVTDVTEVKDLILKKGGIKCISEVELFFIQSKNRSGFSLNDFNHFSSGVQNFITNKSEPKGINPKIANWFKIWKTLEEEIANTDAKINVIVNMCIVFNGGRIVNEQLDDQMKIFQQNIPRCSVVTQVKYKKIGIDKLIKIYNQRSGNNKRQNERRTRSKNKNQSNGEVVFEDKSHNFKMKIKIAVAVIVLLIILRACMGC